jgi:hypothetical protein
VQE